MRKDIEKYVEYLHTVGSLIESISNMIPEDGGVIEHRKELEATVERFKYASDALDERKVVPPEVKKDHKDLVIELNDFIKSVNLLLEGKIDSGLELQSKSTINIVKITDIIVEKLRGK